jgi:hypothetical protein
MREQSRGDVSTRALALGLELVGNLDLGAGGGRGDGGADGGGAKVVRAVCGGDEGATAAPGDGLLPAVPQGSRLGFLGFGGFVTSDHRGGQGVVRGGGAASAVGGGQGQRGRAEEVEGEPEEEGEVEANIQTVVEEDEVGGRIG